jgi:hypothetical protein
MKIEVSKTELAGALSALGKLVCRTSPVEVYRSLRIEGKENKISFQTVGLDEAITYTLPIEGVEEFCVMVNFDEFRTVVRYGRNKSVVLVYEDGRFGIDSTLMRTSRVDWPTERMENGDCEVAELPRLFIGYLSELAPIVDRNNYRQVLRGIHFCSDGLVATNGKELLHISLHLPVENLTIPFPHAVLATKNEDAGRVVTWCEKEYRFFRFEFGNWRWTGKALFGSFPNWRKVIPDADCLNHVVKFDEDEADRLAAFLKTVPDNPPNNPVTLSMGNNSTLAVVPENGMRFDIRAEFPCDWGDLKVSVNKTLLQRLLGEGHRRIAFGSANSPFVAAGGIGRYLAMPLASHTEKVVQPQNQQEESKMNESIPNVAAPLQPVAPIINPETPVNPLDELASAVDEFKTRIRAMFDESTILSRKVKEVALAQKQKEREFFQAKRAIEKIRMAI